jgi:hypothetical protein
LIVSYPSSREIIIWYPSFKTRDSSVPFCEVIPYYLKIKLIIIIIIIVTKIKKKKKTKF